jgi:hypothetical protein
VQVMERSLRCPQQQVSREIQSNPNHLAHTAVTYTINRRHKKRTIKSAQVKSTRKISRLGKGGFAVAGAAVAAAKARWSKHRISKTGVLEADNILMVGPRASVATYTVGEVENVLSEEYGGSASTTMPTKLEPLQADTPVVRENDMPGTSEPAFSDQNLTLQLRTSTT